MSKENEINMDFLKGLEKNICPVCGEEDCPYPRDKRGGKVIEDIMKAYTQGDMTKVKKLHVLKMLPLRKANFGRGGPGSNEGFFDKAQNSKPSMSSFGMLQHFFGKSGRELTLSEIGVHDKVRGLMQKPGAFGRPEGSIQSRFVSQIQSGERVDFENRYNFGLEKKVPIYDPLWGIGGATVSGSLTNVSVEKVGDVYNVSGTINYKLYDKFTDPYDTFNWVKEDINVGGKPFDITGEWKENVSFPVSRQIQENRLMQLLKNRKP
ncbi:hypothetical protein [Photorhabdus temperata]|uniref:Uncharacterized protein n=1 Tax=Photorhabdus temperata J3 TaxID=1389415 RepID=U7QSS4_PHOTE|nr:hypothetical protein [Photorhabdus temperata]EQC01765.1 hypothetical protein B738_01779 [Photorhabdus temperata subsp. temperata M1021]ERT10893.1 hypothetical protein O185_22365 [Photorhabdus temperata J3]